MMKSLLILFFIFSIEVLHAKEVVQTQKELQLLLDVFVYNNDLEEAYAVALKGCKRYPNSLYWQKKALEIAKWSGRAQEAMGHLEFIYEKERSEKIEEELIHYALELYQYERALPLVKTQFLRQQNSENKELLLYVYEANGILEEAAKLLVQEYEKDTTKEKYLSEALALYIETGELQKAHELIKKIKKKKLYTEENLFLLIHYYYTQKNFQKIEHLLEGHADALLQSQKSRHLIFLSDIAWHVAHFSLGAKASLKLIQEGEGRIDDYERAIFYYQNREDAMSYHYAKEGSEKYHQFNLFYTYAHAALKHKKYDELAAFMSKLEAKENFPWDQEALYWLLKAELELFTHHQERAREALDKAKSVAHENIDVLLALFWFYNDFHFDKELRELLGEFEDNPSLAKVFYFPIANAYYALGEIDKSAKWLEKIRFLEMSELRSMEFLFLEASILQARQNQEGFLQKIDEILQYLTRQKELDSTLLKESKFANNYLQAFLYRSSKEQFKKSLQKMQTVLNKADYNSLRYSLALLTGAKEKSHLIYLEMEKKEYWQQLSHAILFGKNEVRQNLLTYHLKHLSLLDASLIAQEDGQYSLAYSLAWDATHKNYSSVEAYRRHLELVLQNANRFILEMYQSQRNELEQNRMKLSSRFDLYGGYKMTLSFEHNKNRALDKTLFQNMPDQNRDVELQIQRAYTKGKLGVALGYHDAMYSYSSYGAYIDHQFNNYTSMRLEYQDKQKAYESVGLLLGGYKQSYETTLVYRPFHSTSATLLMQKNRYSSQEGKKLATGNYLRVGVNRMLRIENADIGVGFFYDQGDYTRYQTAQEGIKNIYRSAVDVIPQNFHNLGLSLSYGMNRADSYVRGIRPYFSFNPYYNCKEQVVNLGFEAGISGRVYHQDQFNLGVRYSNSVYGVSSRSKEFYLRYRRYF